MDKAVIFLLACIGLGATISWFFDSVLPRDNSDPPYGERSGMAILTDNLTGCQYLTTRRGGITPRLDQNGKHICTGGPQ